MTAATRSRLECSASDKTPKLPVTAVKNILRETSTSAAPIDASAAICFAELGLDSEMAVSLPIFELKPFVACGAVFREAREDVRCYCSGGGDTSGMRRGSPWGPRTST